MIRHLPVQCDIGETGFNAALEMATEVGSVENVSLIVHSSNRDVAFLVREYVFESYGTGAFRNIRVVEVDHWPEDHWALATEACIVLNAPPR